MCLCLDSLVSGVVLNFVFISPSLTILQVRPFGAARCCVCAKVGAAHVNAQRGTSQWIMTRNPGQPYIFAYLVQGFLTRRILASVYEDVRCSGIAFRMYHDKSTSITARPR